MDLENKEHSEVNTEMGVPESLEKIVPPAIDQAKILEFIKEYTELTKKHGFEIYPKIDYMKLQDGRLLANQESMQVNKAIKRILLQYHARIIPSLGLTPLRDEIKHDDNTKGQTKN